MDTFSTIIKGFKNNVKSGKQHSIYSSKLRASSGGGDPANQNSDAILRYCQSNPRDQGCDCINQMQVQVAEQQRELAIYEKDYQAAKLKKEQIDKANNDRQMFLKQARNSKLQALNAYHEDQFINDFHPWPSKVNLPQWAKSSRIDTSGNKIDTVVYSQSYKDEQIKDFDTLNPYIPIPPPTFPQQFKPTINSECCTNSITINGNMSATDAVHNVIQSCDQKIISNSKDLDKYTDGSGHPSNSQSSNSQSSTSNTPIIIGSIIGVLLLVVTAVALFFISR